MKDFKQRHNLVKLGFKEVTLAMEDRLKELGFKIRVPILKAREILIYIMLRFVILELDSNMLQLNQCFLNQTLLNKNGRSDSWIKFCLVLRCMLPFSGLRTLCFAVAEISESDFQEWRAVYERASTAVQNRPLKLEESYELIEKVRGRLFCSYRTCGFQKTSVFTHGANKIKTKVSLTPHLLLNLL